MKTLRFHRQIYLGTAVDEAVKTFAPHMDYELAEESDHWVVTLTAKKPPLERRIAGELANYALGRTIEAGGVK
jgi:hypothetical protein